MIKYPVLFKLKGDDELIVISSDTDLREECNALIWEDEDFLIDEQGHTYTVAFNKDSSNLAFKRVGDLSLEEVTEVIQAHMFSQAEVCLTKIQFRNVSEAIHSIIG